MPSPAGPLKSGGELIACAGVFGGLGGRPGEKGLGDCTPEGADALLFPFEPLLPAAGAPGETAPGGFGIAPKGVPAGMAFICTGRAKLCALAPFALPALPLRRSSTQAGGSPRGALVLAAVPLLRCASPVLVPFVLLPAPPLLPPSGAGTGKPGGEIGEEIGRPSVAC